MRNSPPIHTCSEHAQGPSKPPAVVRKLCGVWMCAVSCVTFLILQQNDNYETRAKEKVGWGSSRWNAFVIWWHDSSKMHLLKVAVTQEVFLILTGFGPPSLAGVCPWLHVRACLSQRWSAERHWNIEFCITVILVIAEWPWMPSHTQFVCLSDPLFFDSWLLTSFSSLVLDAFAIKMCSLDMNTECLTKPKVFGVWPLLWPSTCATLLEFNKLIVQYCGKYWLQIHSSHSDFHIHRAEGLDIRVCPTLRISWLPF